LDHINAPRFADLTRGKPLQEKGGGKATGSIFGLCLLKELPFIQKAAKAG